MSRMLALFVTVCCVLSFASLSLAEDSELAALFTANNVEGTIVLTSEDGEHVFIHNDNRAQQRLVPASTFKILNTLIALDEHVVANEQEVIKWDGKKRGYPAWNKDHSIKTAFPVSCVWFYQELARRIGLKNYNRHLAEAHYGNQIAGPDVTDFWLVGDLGISAIEQISFLRVVKNQSLPYSQNNQRMLKQLLILKKTPEYTLYGKTGWATRVAQPHGWFVGFIETKDTTWYFATNIIIKKKRDAQYRKKLTIEALKAKNIIS